MKTIGFLILLWGSAILLRTWGDGTVWYAVIKSAGMVALTITIIYLIWRYLINGKNQ